MLPVLRRFLAPEPPPVEPAYPDEDRWPLGVFKTCSEGLHVMQWWETRCQGCEGRRPAPSPPPAPEVPVDPRGEPTRARRPVQAEDPPPVQPLRSPAPPAPSPARPRLTQVMQKVQDQPGAGLWGRLVLEWDLEAPEVRVGSSPDCQVALTALGHAGRLLTLRAGAPPVVEPAAPGVPVLLNGRELTRPTPLRHDDRITLHHLTFRVELVSPPALRTQ